MATIGNFIATFTADMNGFLRPMQESADAMESFQSKMGSAGAIALGLGASMSAVGLPFAAAAKSAIDMADGFSEMSTRSGASVEALSAIAFHAGQAGANGAAVEKAFKNSAKIFEDASTGSNAAAASLGKLGLSAGTLLSLSPDERFFAMAEGLAAIQDPSTKAAVSMEVWGKAGADLVPILNTLATGQQAVMDGARDFGALISTTAAQSANDFNDSLFNLSASFKGIFNSIVTSGLLNKLTDFANNTATIVTKFTTAHPHLVEAAAVIGGITVVLGPLLTALGLAAIAIGALSAPVLAIFGAAGVIVAAGVAIAAFASTNEDLMRFLEDTWTSIKDVADTAFSGIRDICQTVADSISAIWAVWGDGLTASFTAHFVILKGIIGPAWDAIKGIVGGALDIIKGAIQIFTGVVTGDWGTFTTGIKNVWGGLWDAIKAAITAPIDAIKNTVGGFATAVSDSFRNMYDKVIGRSYVPDLISGIGTEFAKLPGIMTNPVKTITDSVVGSFENMFGGIIDGFTKNIPIIGGAVGDLLKQLSGGLIDKGMGALGLGGLLSGGGSGAGSAASGAGSVASGIAGGASSMMSGLAGGAISAAGSIIGALMGEGNARRTEENTRETRDWLELMATAWNPLIHQIEHLMEFSILPTLVTIKDLLNELRVDVLPNGFAALSGDSEGSGSVTSHIPINVTGMIDEAGATVLARALTGAVTHGGVELVASRTLMGAS